MRKNRTYHRKNSDCIFRVHVYAFGTYGANGSISWSFALIIMQKRQKSFMNVSGILRLPGGGFWTEMERYWRITKRFVPFRGDS